MARLPSRDSDDARGPDGGQEINGSCGGDGEKSVLRCLRCCYIKEDLNRKSLHWMDVAFRSAV